MAETGHARNVEHFEQMISFCDGYGVDYDPSNGNITVAKLQNKLIASQDAINAVAAMLAPWKVAVNTRQQAFEGIRRLTTRVVNSFAASGAPDNAIEDAKGFKREIDGARAKTLPPDDPNTPEDESQGISVAQTSYTQLVEHFDDLIELLTNSGYAPNEVELQLGTLNTYSASLKAANSGVINANTPLSNARIARDDVMYKDDEGLVDLAALVKKYVKSLYGADSPQFAQISGLEFTRPK